MFFMTLRVLPCLSAASLLLASGCTPDTPPSRPRLFLAITHSALNRLSFFDLDHLRYAADLRVVSCASDHGYSLATYSNGAHKDHVFLF